MFSNYGVLSERELHSRYEVVLEQYVIKLNIEAETAADIAATMLLPAAARHLAILKGAGLTALAKETTDPDRRRSRRRSRRCRRPTSTRTTRRISWRRPMYMRDTVFAAMDDVRAVADTLERTVADDLWPLPRYSEMLFIR